MELKYSFKMKNNRIFPIISIRDSSNDNYVEISKYQFNLITKMFNSWGDWWEEVKEATLEKERLIVNSKGL